MVLIPAGKTVSVNSNNNEAANYMELRIAGILKFVGGGSKLKIATTSVIYIFPTGKIQTSQNSQQLQIGSNTVANGTNSLQTITGPSVARSNTNGFEAYSPSALPVTFLAFTATQTSGKVIVQWSTSLEVNALNFEVELSEDGRSWSRIGTVDAAGNSSSVREYAFTASNLPAGNLQFRIHQVDIDGKATYSAVRSLKMTSSEAAVRISALSGRVLLQFGSERRNVVVRVMGMNGQILQEQKLGFAAGAVLVPATQAGIKLVAVTADDELLAATKLVL